MKRVMISAVVMGLANCLWAAATVTEGTMEMPTCGFSDPNPVPNTDSAMYPYFRFDGSTAVASNRHWKTVTLENDKVRVVMLPEVGGKVWGATDKKSGCDFIYFNHVVKFRDIAMRGPWSSGGIEFNFGIIGHAPTSATPVDTFTRENDDGSVSYFASATEWINRTTWQVEVRLPADADYFLTRTTWFNGANLSGPYYQWMNAAFSAQGNPRFVFPGKSYIGHGGDIHDWHTDEEGHDLSTYAENAFGGSKSYHVLNGNTGMYGVWWPEKNFGSIHENAVYDKYGRKVWIWALSRSGAIWEGLLTDTDGQYVELQSGRCFNQPGDNSMKTPFKHASFAPGATDFFEEKWGAVHSRAELDAAATNHPPVVRPGKLPTDFNWESAYGLYVQGEQKYRQRLDSQAEKLLRTSLEKEPHFVPALGLLAELRLRRGDGAEARMLAAHALSLDTYDALANYVDGLAAMEDGDRDTAMERLGLAAYSPLYRSAAYAKIAKCLMAQGKWNEALETVKRSLLANPMNLDAQLAGLVCHRQLGLNEKAQELADWSLDRFPLFHGARYEQKGKEFIALVRNEFPDQTCIELGGWYEEAACWKEALEIFGLAENSPIALIRKAYVLHRLGRDEEAQEALRKASSLPIDYALVFRRESMPALRWACETNTGWKFRYWLAVLKAYFGDNEGAKLLLTTCTNPDSATFYLYRAKFLKGDEARADLKNAKALNDSWRVGYAQYRLEAAASAWEAALAVTKEYLAKYPENNPIQLAHAEALVRNKAYRECVELMRGIHILPSENNNGGHAIWRRAWIGIATEAFRAGKKDEAKKALQQVYEYPENLGEGKPYDSEIKCQIPDELKGLLP
ncbi:MAG: DUF5107 domain-containing protein [Kiritimatiellae bacterium]|nr:DUF5107 domain-containing protein [Kiritimatiellia bacterium]